MEIAPKEAEVTETPKETKPKEQKPKEQKPKEEKKKEEKKKEEKHDDAEEEEEVFEDEKKKSPLDLLPKSTFDLEEWKRYYSNNDTRGKAIPWFWEKLDRAGYSIWFADYKYNQELEKVFMTANLLSGFIQRLEKMRKYSFASMVIFGEEGNLQIGIAYMIRGTEFPPFADFEVDDAEHYTWRKADLDNSADKELINDFWAWDGTFGGKYKAFNQAKIFK
jgi:elongation factor 1-gamma